MATSATSGFGTILAYGDAATPEVFTTIVEMLDIDGPEYEQGTTEATTNESANNAAEHISTKVVQAGMVNAKIQYLLGGTTHKILLTKLYLCTALNYKLTSPQTSTPFTTFKAFIKKFKAIYPVQGTITADVSWLITEKPTLPA